VPYKESQPILSTQQLSGSAPKITGRLKDLINRGGENIYPREIEDIQAAHAGIAEVSAFGVPDAR
jgi:acyl-CoA synthetase (AMP-forming)/AMP-acid ligase II